MTTRLAGRGDAVPAVQPGLAAAPGSTAGPGNPANPDGLRHRLPVGAGVAAGRLAGPAGRVRPRRGRPRRDGKKTGRQTAVPPLPPVARGPAAARGDPGDRAGHEPAGAALRRVGEVEHHRLARRTGCPACTPRRVHGELTEPLQAAGLGADQPVFDKVIVITDRRVLDRQLQATVAGFEHTPGTIVKIDQDSEQLKAALGGATRPGSSSPRCRSSPSSPRSPPSRPPATRRPGRPTVRGDRRRGALVHLG